MVCIGDVAATALSCAVAGICGIGSWRREKRRRPPRAHWGGRAERHWCHRAIGRDREAPICRAFGVPSPAAVDLWLAAAAGKLSIPGACFRGRLPSNHKKGGLGKALRFKRGPALSTAAHAPSAAGIGTTIMQFYTRLLAIVLQRLGSSVWQPPHPHGNSGWCSDSDRCDFMMFLV